MKIHIKELQSSYELKQAFPVLQQLRSHLGEREFLLIYDEANKRDDFRLYGAFDAENETCVGVLSMRTLWDFLHGKHLVVDDVVVAKDARTKGIGSKLLRFADSIAVTQGCELIRASAGVLNEVAKHLYEKEGFRAKSISYKRKLQSLNEDM